MFAVVRSNCRKSCTASSSGTAVAAAAIHLVRSLYRPGRPAITAAPMTGAKVIQDRRWSAIETLLSG